MTITAVPADPEPDDAFHREYEATRAAFEKVPGHDIELSAEAQVLGSIFSVAIAQDTVVQHYEDRIDVELGRRGDGQPFREDDSRLNDHTHAVVESLQGDELEAFMRPIFEESGIGERFG